MKLEIQHIEVHVSSMIAAKEFYIDKLGLELIDENPAINLCSVKAGGVRISIFAGYEPKVNNNNNTAGTHIIFRTDDIDSTLAKLQEKGVIFHEPIFEAPGFLRGITTSDPDGNTIEIAEYFRDPLGKNV